MSQKNFQISASNQGNVEAIQDGWRLSIPAGEAGSYRLAQLDDYGTEPRKRFAWNAPVGLELRARASSSQMPGTWGFGFWNDPFALSLGFGGKQRIPSLPNAAWFFFASSENHLSLRDNLPASGSMTAVFHAQPKLLGLFALATPLLPLIMWKPTSKILRRWASLGIQQDAHQLELSTHEWHSYSLLWEEEQVRFWVDDQAVFSTTISPHPPLGLVLWIDNQYAAWPPNGKISYGTLSASDEQWIELKDIRLSA